MIIDILINICYKKVKDMPLFWTFQLDDYL